jgi:hypothetical protein
VRTLHLCQFGFRTTNIRRVGHVLDGGTALSGIIDQVEPDGGGYLQADFSNGTARTKVAGNAWRVISDADAGEAFIVLLCAERRFQPVGAVATVTHSDDTPFDDDTPYESGSADYETTVDAALRATTLQISGTSTTPLIGGELFSIQHANWGWRAYRVRSIDGDTITFRPPLREAVAAGTALEFDTPRCQMMLTGATADNTTDMGRFTSCAASFTEDMRPPES